MTQTQGGAHGEGTQGEVVISGVDTGPGEGERENLTPTEDHARFQPAPDPYKEPEDEDG
ncbi:hypothetical protein [Deinococcus planocerae]|uniref:hypothetical protein n=1 Tax=Deinococcus planocerae TaxID=1737569 RepID=UPI0015E0F058|nr:hypothetical protein [Deinococcus planocerae]